MQSNPTSPLPDAPPLSFIGTWQARVGSIPGPIRRLLTYIGAFALALIVFAIVLLALGKDPIAVYKLIYNGTLADEYGRSEIVVKMIPFMLCALAVAIPTVLHAIVFVGDQESRVGEDNLELARIVGLLTEGQIEQTFVLLDFVTTAPGIADDLRAGDARRLTDRLDRAVRLDDTLSSILIVDRSGVVLAHTMPDKQLVGQSTAGWSMTPTPTSSTGCASPASAARPCR